jgi:uroporphyrin-III C-methyltransferase/precorrin-2 dehydrogenase/sirohydrochlorin ferrochelatase
VDVVFAASTDDALDQAAHDAARARHVPVNVVDRPGKCSFIMPSIIDRSPVMVAVSSGGEAPVLSRLLRARLETLIPAAYGRLAALAGRFKQEVRSRFHHHRTRRKFWEKAFLSPIAEMVFSGREQEAEANLKAMLEADSDAPGTGEVYLVGAGPGNPDLLTFRALRLMQQADVVVYDRLVSPAILDMCRRDADRFYVGKERDNHAVPQEEINMVLVRLAKEGKRVLRLKGGDPFIFGRGGEEIETLREHDVPFQVVPAVTAAAGVASYAGIPLTHRDHAQALILVTGHLKDGTMDLDWDMLCRPRQTIVIYMGLKGPGHPLRRDEEARHARRHAGRHRAAGHHAEPENRHRHPRHPAGPGGPGRIETADPDHRRQRGQPACQAELVPPGRGRRRPLAYAAGQTGLAGHLSPNKTGNGVSPIARI